MHPILPAPTEEARPSTRQRSAPPLPSLASHRADPSAFPSSRARATRGRTFPRSSLSSAASLSRPTALRVRAGGRGRGLVDGGRAWCSSPPLPPPPPTPPPLGRLQAEQRLDCVHALEQPQEDVGHGRRPGRLSQLQAREKGAGGEEGQPDCQGAGEDAGA